MCTIYSTVCIVYGIVCVVHPVWCMDHDTMCHVVLLSWSWGGSVLHVVGSVYDQMGLLNSGPNGTLEQWTLSTPGAGGAMSA